MHRGTTSLPQGEATCLACRRRSPKPRRSGRPAPYVPRPPREWDCVVCGLHVTAAARSRGAKLCQAHKWWKPTNCTTCGRRHYSANRSTAGRAVYCSDDCKPVREPREPKPPTTTLQWKQCRCGKWMCNPRRKWCTSECWRSHTYPIRKGTCDDCGNVVDNNQATYCQLCRNRRKKASEAAYRRKRRQRYGRSHRARARQHGVEYERIDRTVVYQRDGWRCGICQRKVDRRLKSPHPMSASLDHIVPMSHGGPHLYVNVQCAHHLCNSLKSDRGAGDQLALIG